MATEQNICNLEVVEVNTPLDLMLSGLSVIAVSPSVHEQSIT